MGIVRVGDLAVYQDSAGLQVPALGEVRSGKGERVVEEERKPVPRRAKTAPRNKREQEG